MGEVGVSWYDVAPLPIWRAGERVVGAGDGKG